MSDGQAGFGKLSRSEPLSRKVADMIMREITSGALKPGDRLPTEHELCGMFDVGRNVVREAIACLRADGLVTARQGLGAFVAEPELRQTIRLNVESLRDPSNLEALFELRAMIEIEAAGLAAARRTEEQLEALEAAYDRMSGTEKWAESGIDADLEFHRRLAEATGNPYIVTFLSFVSQHMRETIMEARRKHEMSEIVETTLAEHLVILDAVRASACDSAREAMRQHIMGAARRLKASAPSGRA